MLSKFKRNKHQQHLAQLPKLSQSVDDIEFFYAPADFRQALLARIAQATQRICIIALYLEQDDGGKGILQALYDAKRQRPELDVQVLVDWHRAQRGRIGAAASNTNADWYCRMAQETPVSTSRFMAFRSIPGKRSAFSISKALSLMTACSTAAPV
ncbi:CDP-diacylglycerol--serine O-phosphatidyltransferase [Klebsiella grimontii]|uniref:CDP-diacylglycerol--serine O-phosphatidyltransferase n=1 Tax=Klebsiella grimontii TaxID=2058152 RepID=A0A7H4NYR8_9ENTR|nr:CDP-diacylglycerol--serine O-phosphatidyltransferase [Klebsiella grimontii]